MMRTVETPLGVAHIGEREELFDEAIRRIAVRTAGDSVALTGGSTPLALYRWVVETAAMPAEAAGRVDWFASDERHVPMESSDSNFGNAVRGMLDPLGVPAERRFPWKVDVAPAASAAAMLETWGGRARPDRGFDLCFLGMGDDGHTASLFPGSPLVRTPVKEFFGAVEVPGKGWRLTVTPAGLEACGEVVVMLTGAAKAEALRSALANVDAVEEQPVRLLGRLRDRVSWLIDEGAADGLS